MFILVECLPKDTREFYQFCYVDASGRVCGASSPFQFIPLTPDDEDLIEVEDMEDSEILVITSKTKILMQELEGLKKEKEDLEQVSLWGAIIKILIK